MKKYLFIFKSEFMTSIQYAFDICSKFISYLLLIIIFVSLWNYIYSDPSEVINGYSMSQMIWYVIATELIWMVASTRRATAKISDDIKSGGVVYKINKPYNYINYNIATNLGEIAVKLIMFAIFAAIVGYLFIGSFPPISIPMILIFFISTIIAIITNSIFAICIGLISFYIEDSAPLHWLYSKLVLVLGTLFPVEYFPGIFGRILKYSPIVALCYGPAKLFVEFSYSLAWKVLLAQLFYLLLSYVIAQLIYKKGVKKLNVNGG